MPDAKLTWWSPTDAASLVIANTGHFIREDDTPFTFLWASATLEVEGVRDAVIELVARGDFMPNAARRLIRPTNGHTLVNVEDAQVLIARLTELERLRDAGAPFREGPGRKFGQKTALSPTQVAEVTAYVKQRRAAGDRWGTIITELKKQHSEDQYEHKWNERTLRRWLNTGHKSDINRRAR